jgi:hypothetical protein
MLVLATCVIEFIRKLLLENVIKRKYLCVLEHMLICRTFSPKTIQKPHRI